MSKLLGQGYCRNRLPETLTIGAKAVRRCSLSRELATTLKDTIMNDKDKPMTYADEVIAVLNEKIETLERSNAHLREELRLLKEYLKNLRIVPR